MRFMLFNLRLQAATLPALIATAIAVATAAMTSVRADALGAKLLAANMNMVVSFRRFRRLGRIVPWTRTRTFPP